MIFIYEVTEDRHSKPYDDRLVYSPEPHSPVNRSNNQMLNDMGFIGVMTAHLVGITIENDKDRSYLKWVGLDLDPKVTAYGKDHAFLIEHAIHSAEWAYEDHLKSAWTFDDKPQRVN